MGDYVTTYNAYQEANQKPQIVKTGVLLIKFEIVRCYKGYHMHGNLIHGL